MKTPQSLHKRKQTRNLVRDIFNSLARRASQLIAFGLFCTTVAVAQGDPVDWVNLYIGTGSGPIGYGGTMPFVTPPFGMTDWTPQTRQNKLSGVSYKYEDTTISGFIGINAQTVAATVIDTGTIIGSGGLAARSDAVRRLVAV